MNHTFIIFSHQSQWLIFFNIPLVISSLPMWYPMLLLLLSSVFSFIPVFNFTFFPCLLFLSDFPHLYDLSPSLFSLTSLFIVYTLFFQTLFNTTLILFSFIPLSLSKTRLRAFPQFLNFTLLTSNLSNKFYLAPLLQCLICTGFSIRIQWINVCEKYVCYVYSFH
jgi:hypothetical protein